MQVVQESWPAIWAMVRSGGAAAWHDQSGTARASQIPVLAVNATVIQAEEHAVTFHGQIPDLEKASTGFVGAAEACFIAQMSAQQPVIDARRELNHQMKRLR